MDEQGKPPLTLWHVWYMVVGAAIFHLASAWLTSDWDKPLERLWWQIGGGVILYVNWKYFGKYENP